MTIAMISADSSLVGLRVIHILKRGDNITLEKYTFESIRKRLQFMKYKSNYLTYLPIINWMKCSICTDWLYIANIGERDLGPKLCKLLWFL